VWYDVAEVPAGPATPLACTGPRRVLHPGRRFDQAIQQLDYAKRRAGGNFQLASQMDARQQEFRDQEKILKEMMGG
jgi:hypothetical protein